MPEGSAENLEQTLREAQRLGFLGSADTLSVVAHALGFAQGFGVGTVHVLDLGSGGGVPGLPLAVAHPDLRVVLLEGGERRGGFLIRAVGRLGVAERVRVVLARAEEAGRDPELRGAFDAVVARGFGPPDVTAECASPFLRVYGRLVVSEPPADAPARWTSPILTQLGMRPVAPAAPGYAVVEQMVPCPVRFPRQRVRRRGRST